MPKICTEYLSDAELARTYASSGDTIDIGLMALINSYLNKIFPPDREFAAHLRNLKNRDPKPSSKDWIDEIYKLANGLSSDSAKIIPPRKQGGDFEEFLAALWTYLKQHQPSMLPSDFGVLDVSICSCVGRDGRTIRIPLNKLLTRNNKLPTNAYEIYLLHARAVSDDLHEQLISMLRAYVSTSFTNGWRTHARHINSLLLADETAAEVSRKLDSLVRGLMSYCESTALSANGDLENLLAALVILLANSPHRAGLQTLLNPVSIKLSCESKFSLNSAELLALLEIPIEPSLVAPHFSGASAEAASAARSAGGAMAGAGAMLSAAAAMTDLRIMPPSTATTQSRSSPLGVHVHPTPTGATLTLTGVTLSHAQSVGARISPTAASASGGVTSPHPHPLPAPPHRREVVANNIATTETAAALTHRP